LRIKKEILKKSCVIQLYFVGLYLKTETMTDLVDFKNAQIKALQDSNAQKEARIAILETWIFELTDDKCPRDYKQVIRTELLKTN
jgi:hypothetical protein